MGSVPSDPGDDQIEAGVGDEQLYIASASASQTRVQGILPSKGSEDVSHLLGSISSHEERASEESQQDYLPDMATEWVIDVSFAGDPRLDPKVVSGLFGTEWRQRHGGLTIFALDSDTGRWTFLISANGPREVTRLKMAWDFIDPTVDDAELPSAQFFSARVAAVQEAVQHLGRAELGVSFSPDEAAHRAQWLWMLKARLDYSPAVILHAPQGKKFEGLDIWEVMLCLGLKWGDMDVFHWENPGGTGDDHLFSVWTSTPPGYFFPEAISAGKVRFNDLVFGFSVPRCSEPGQVFEGMVRAVEYAQKRLGGTITDDTGGEKSLDSIRQKIRTIEHELKSNGFTPGAESTLHLF